VEGRETDPGQTGAITAGTVTLALRGMTDDAERAGGNWPGRLGGTAFQVDC
jgi:hypothetical protein